jgi:DNA-binding NarL/FixJ family response regulator
MTSVVETGNAAAPFVKRQTCRVLLVDDHPLFRDGLRVLLNEEAGFFVEGEAESEEGAFRSFVDSQADLVIVDVSLASGNGLNLISRIKELRPATIVLVISMYEDPVYADLALAAGASGYVCKRTGCQEVKTAIQEALKGGVYISPSLQKESRTEGKFENAAQALQEKRLSSRELQIFTMIGQGRTTHDIAAELQIAVSTVETYRERLKAKLSLPSGSALVRHAIFWMMQNT